MTETCEKVGRSRVRAMSLIEVIVALAIVAIVFVVIIPQLRAIRNSWASARESAELVQTGQALMGHATCELSQALQITSVSGPNETDGYIEFINNDGNTVRYDIAASNYVEFGQLGSLSEIGGPVSRLQFVCYDAYNLNTPITDVNSIRFVKTVVTVTDPTGTIDDKTFTAGTYIRTNVADAGGGGDPNNISVGTSYYSGSHADCFSLSRIDATHHLFAYQTSYAGARVITVNPDMGLVTFNAVHTAGARRNWPALCKIDNTHHLRACEFGVTQGGASVLTIDPAKWSITEEAHHEYASKSEYPALSRIDSTHYLCVYRSTGGDGWAVVLTVNPADWSVSHEVSFEFDSGLAELAGLARVDESHYLCVYRGSFKNCTAVVLKVNTSTWTITAGTPLVLEEISWWRVPLAKIDTTHFLCTYNSILYGIRAVVFVVDTSTRSVTASAPFEFIGAGHGNPDVEALDAENFICAYMNGTSNEGYVVLLQVESGSYNVSKGEAVLLSSDVKSACLSRVDDARLLCVYSSASTNEVYGVVITYGGGQIRP